MANEVLLGLKIGGVVSGSFNAAFGSAKTTVQQLGRATDGLTAKQQTIGNALSASLARGGTGLVQLRRQYQSVGNAIDQLKAKQDSLTASIERVAVLKGNRRELRGQAMEVIGTGVALGAPVMKSFNTAVDFQDQTRDIAITGGFNPAQEQRLSMAMRGAALRWNQTQTDVANGTAILIAGGIDNLQELTAYAPVMAKTATATRASMKDLGSVAIALNDNLGIGAAGLERAMNMLAFAGKSGQFELADMAKWLPQLTPQFAALGITGERAVAEIGASLQIARRGAGSNDEAANNYKNFLSKLTAPESLKAFEKAGIDLKGSMKNLVSEGLSPAQAMLNILTAHLGKKAPAAAAEYGKALSIKDEQERQTALARLDEAYKLGALFADQQVLSFIRPALANQQDLASIEQGSKSAADQGLLDQDWTKRMGSSKEQLKELRNNLTDIGLSVGSALLPAIVDVSRAVVPLMRSFSAWSEQHPNLIRGVVGLVGGLLLGKLAFISVAYGAQLVMAPFVAMTTTVTALSAKWTLLRGLWQTGKFAPLITRLSRISDGLLKVVRSALRLGKTLGGTLVVGLKLAGQAVLWLGRALMLNPIGLLITGIALAAYLIYRHWAPIKTFFTGLWDEVTTGFSGGLSGIVGLLVNFSPVGWFNRAFAGVMSYFGIELPGTFTEFGGLLVTGLVNGISNMAGALKDSVVGIGSSVKGWFTETLGIESPSRVFIGYGANISEGAALGIRAQAGLVRQAALGMAAQSAVDMAPPNPAQVTQTSMASALKDSVVGIGSSVKGWFTETLGIEPLNRIFIGYGANISEGAALGIRAQAGRGRQAALGMAAQSAVEMAPPNPAQVTQTSMASALKDSVVGIGSSVKNWFTETLDIESLNRIFIGYGANISEGAALGISAQAGRGRQAALGMAAQSAVDIAPPNPAQVTQASMIGAASRSSAVGGSEFAGPMTFHFSPQINLPNGAGMDQINQGLHASYAEWVRLMERYLHDKRRRSYGPADEVTA